MCKMRCFLGNNILGGGGGVESLVGVGGGGGGVGWSLHRGG